MKNKNPLVKARDSKYYEDHKKDSDAKIRLAKVIYEERKEKGLTQKELADKANITQSIVSDLESAVYNPGFELLNRIIEVLEINSEKLAELFNRPIGFPYFSNYNQEAIYKN